MQQPQLFVSYLSPPSFAPGDRELDLIANLLANGKSSRLYRRLVYEMKIAQAVSASEESQKLASNFEITASPMPGHTLDELLAVIDEEVDKLRREPPAPRELERAKNQLESDTVRNLEALQPRAERLQSYNYLLGDPGFLGEDLRLYRAVDAAAIQRVATQYLRKDGPRGRDRRAQSGRAHHGTGEEMKTHDMTPSTKRAARVGGAALAAVIGLGACATQQAARRRPPPADGPARARPGAGGRPRPPRCWSPRRRRRRPDHRRRPAERATPDAPFRANAPAPGAGAAVQGAGVQALQAEERPRGDPRRVPRPAARRRAAWSSRRAAARTRPSSPGSPR